jgi:DNA/RNA-binding domain of Phe-tRNA-synthetase-like protein
MKLIVSPEVAVLGIRVAMARFRGAKVSNRSNPLEKRKKEALDAICAIDIEAHPVLAAYRELHRLVGVDGVVPPAQHLISLAKANGRLPNINTVVDCYNLVSAQTGFSIGAHDCAHLRGDVAFRITGGGERYWPLGEPKLTPVRAGQYACMDDEKIVCLMDVKQCEETRITKQTSEFVIYVQGNSRMTPHDVQDALERLGALVTEICGGTCEMVGQAPTSERPAGWP